MIRPLRFCVALMVAAVAGAPLAMADHPACDVPSDLIQVDAKLPHLGKRMHTQQPVTIVAIGGGSTMGTAAGPADLAYPHRLQLALAEAFPQVPIKVVNKGIPRQSARQMFDRFPADVFADDPALVIWETGIIDAVRGVEPDEFAGAVQDGIDALKNRSIDTVLMDMQFSRKSTELIDFDRYLKALHRIGEINDLYVFPRYQMMRYWSEQNMFNFEETGANERAEIAARVYDCIGRKLAEAIRLAVQ